MGFKKYYLSEGGNAVSNVTRINQENVDATMKEIYKKVVPSIGITKTNTGLLGSTGKKNLGSSSGDIDVSVDMTPVLKKDKSVSTTDDIYNHMIKGVKPLGYEIADLRSIGLISIAWPIAKGPDPERWQEGEFVQLDLMPTDNLDWSVWAYYSPSEKDSPWKGLYRNQLLIQIAKHMDEKVLEKALNKEGIEVTAKWERNFFDMGQGLLRGVQSVLNKKGSVVKTKKTIEKKLMTKDPTEIVQMFFGPKYQPRDILTWDDTFKAINSSDFVYKKKKDVILKELHQSLINLGMTVPKELKRYG